MNAVNQARASLPFRPTGRSIRVFELFAATSGPAPNVNDAPYTEGWESALLPYHSGAALLLPIA